MLAPQTTHPSPIDDIDALEEIADHVLWLATAIIHHANRIRPNPRGMKVGGRQASCASMVEIMTSLYFEHLQAGDRVSVKPHASPVLHSINYLLGALDESYLSRLRELGGLQSYPSRTKDPDPIDYSTGSVGIGATAPIWGAIARRYVDTVFGGAGKGRQYSLVGDAELDEGAVWEAILDPSVSELGEIVWIIDMNRQSLDRIVPNIAAGRIAAMFSANGWQVIDLKFGKLLEALFEQPGGESLRQRIVDMPNSEYQRLLRCSAEQLRSRLPGDGPHAAAVAELIADLDDDALVRTFGNLGGHDLRSLREAFNQIDDTRPTAIIAYTIKGHRLPIQGHPQNHSSLLTAEEFDELATRLAKDPARPWVRPAADSPAAGICRTAAERLRRSAIDPIAPPAVPMALGRKPLAVTTTQAALGRTLLDLSREAPEVASRIVTVSPDVTSTTNLAGWLNKVGVWSPSERLNWFHDDTETIMHWRERPTGQHIELGIAETNLVSLLGELGATWSRWGQPLFPIGVVYDPFVERALEPWSFGIYSGGQSILVGTPAGVTLSAEGGAHQSIKTPSIGVEQPGCTAYEPAFAVEVEWILLHCLSRLGRADGRSAYLRLSTRPVQQELCALPGDPAAAERRRRQVIAGAYPVRPCPQPAVTIAAVGALVTEGLQAAERLAHMGIAAEVICITSPGLLFEAMQGRCGRSDSPTWILDQVFAAERAAPMVTVLDGHPHTLAFLPSINKVPGKSLGVSEFGQSGSLEQVFGWHGIDTDSIVRAALDLID